MAGQKLNEFNFEVLRYLRAYAATGKGWEWRRVKGWIFANEFPQLLRLASSYLPTLVRHYSVDLSDVRDPFQDRPTYLYRISGVGLAMLAAHEREAGEPNPLAETTIEPPAEHLSAEELETVFLSAAQWRGLEYLERHRSRGLAYTPAEILKAIDFRFYMNDADLLVRKDLAVEEQEAGGPRTFRVSRLGRRARAVDTTTSKYTVKVHVPGILAAAETHSNAKEKRPAAERQRTGGIVSGG